MKATEGTAISEIAVPDGRYGECTVCGFPVFRKGMHAEWCSQVAEMNRAANQLQEDRRRGRA